MSKMKLLYQNSKTITELDKNDYFRLTTHNITTVLGLSGNR